MTASWYLYACGIAILSCGLIAGVFLFFSDFGMVSLGQVPSWGGAHAMQVINREVYRTVFMVLLISMVPLSLVLGGLAVWGKTGAAMPWLVSASVFYFVGVVLVTGLGNVPMNEKLAGLDPGSASSAPYWRFYLGRWTQWNHVRTAASVAASLCYLVGLVNLVASGASR